MNSVAICARRRTTKGRKLIRWTGDEIKKLHEYYASGLSREQIAASLNMPVERIKQRLQWEQQSGRLLTLRKQRRAAQRAETRSEQKTPRVFIERIMAAPQPSQEQLRLRDLRTKSPPRDLAGMLFGDPPCGFSALDQRRGA